MFDDHLLSLATGRRRNELKPLIVAFTDALVRHKLAASAGPRPGRANPPHKFLAAECGVWQGDSLLLCAALAQALEVPVEIFGLDTFSGLPALGQRDLEDAPEQAPYRFKRWFADTTYEQVQAKLHEAGASNTVHLVEGLFAETLPTLPEGPYSFVNVDCDLYDGHIECLTHFVPRMARGGIVYFDDYHSIDFPMARSAIDDFLAKDTELELIHVRFGPEGANQTKAMIVIP